MLARLCPLLILPLLALGGGAFAETPCWAQKKCWSSGECTPKGDHCVAAGVADCLLSEECRELGVCSFIGGRCAAAPDPSEPPEYREPLAATDTVVSCKDTPACHDGGHCAFAHDRNGVHCEPGSVDDCLRSAWCTYAGDCRCPVYPNPNGADVASPTCEPSDARRKKSKACRRDGLCPSTALCKRSTVCRERGLCAHSDDPYVYGVYWGCASADDKSCASSAECMALGHCASDEQVCGAATDAHCKASKACSDHGACTAVSGQCRRYSPSEVTSCSEDRLRVVKPARVSASSVHAPFKRYRFDAANVADGDPRTSWQPVTEKDGGAGEAITLHFDTPQKIVALEVGNGFLAATELGDLFQNNNRARQATVELDGGTKEHMVFDPYHRGLVRVGLPATETGQVTLRVHTIAKGILWNDLAISEVRAMTCAP